jgi:hypothetical protein
MRNLQNLPGGVLGVHFLNNALEEAVLVNHLEVGHQNGAIGILTIQFATYKFISYFSVINKIDLMNTKLAPTYEAPEVIVFELITEGSLLANQSKNDSYYYDGNPFA